MRISIKFDDKQICEVLQTAIDAGYTYGIGYWGTRLLWKKKGKLRAVVYEHHDQRNPKKYTRHELDFERGLRMTLMNPPGGYGGQFEVRDGEIECDGPGADYFIQMCVFGEQKYG